MEQVLFQENYGQVLTNRCFPQSDQRKSLRELVISLARRFSERLNNSNSKSLETKEEEFFQELKSCSDDKKINLKINQCPICDFISVDRDWMSSGLLEHVGNTNCTTTFQSQKCIYRKNLNEKYQYIFMEAMCAYLLSNNGQITVNGKYTLTTARFHVARVPAARFSASAARFSASAARFSAPVARFSAPVAHVVSDHVPVTSDHVPVTSAPVRVPVVSDRVSVTSAPAPARVPVVSVTSAPARVPVVSARVPVTSAPARVPVVSDRVPVAHVVSAPARVPAPARVSVDETDTDTEIDSDSEPRVKSEPRLNIPKHQRPNLSLGFNRSSLKIGKNRSKETNQRIQEAEERIQRLLVDLKREQAILELLKQ